jgi:uncharacterized protein
MKIMTRDKKDIMCYALITGGTSGIGYELAKCLAADKIPLVLVARSEEGLQKTAAEFRERYGVDVKTIAKDLVVPGAAREVYEQVKAMGLTVDVLVNDAGQGVWGRFAGTELDKEIDLVHLNIISLVSLTKYFLREMLQRGNGKILQLASQLAKVTSPYMAVYAALKPLCALLAKP